MVETPDPVATQYVVFNSRVGHIPFFSGRSFRNQLRCHEWLFSLLGFCNGRDYLGQF